MSFRDFTFPEVQQALGLTVQKDDLFSAVPPMELQAEFVARLREGTDLALDINTEKARSEFIIAPVLLELRHQLRGSFGLFSGIELDVDPARGLNGICDFILTRSPRQIILTAPLVAIVEAKNDNVRTGLGQCIASMVAAHEFNQRSGTALAAVYGAVTTGSAWRFLRLSPPEVTVDLPEYYIVDPGRIMGILAHILKSG